MPQVRALSVASSEALDEAGYDHVGILAYSVKYASCFYGPFRQAAGTSADFGHRLADVRS